MSNESPGFIVGRKGIVFLLREDGSSQKCGIAVRDGQLQVYDQRSNSWAAMPEQLTNKAGRHISIVVFEEDAL